MVNAKISPFFKDYVRNLMPGKVKLDRGVTLYRGSRFSVSGYMGEMNENRFFSKSFDTAVEYAETSSGQGDPYVVILKLSGDVVLYDIPYPSIYIRAANGDAIYDVEAALKRRLPERYISTYRDLIARDRNERFSMICNVTPQDWQRLEFVDALMSVDQSNSQLGVSMQGYISEESDEVLLYSSVMAAAQMHVQAIPA